MLISVDCVSSKEWLDFVGLSTISSDIDCVVEFVCEFFPLLNSSACVNLFLLFLLHVVEIDKIAVLIRAPIASDEKRTQSELDGIIL